MENVEKKDQMLYNRLPWSHRHIMFTHVKLFEIKTSFSKVNKHYKYTSPRTGRRYGSAGARKS